MLAFTLPLGPSVNHMYAVTSRGVRLTDDAKRFKTDAARIVQNAAQLQSWQYQAGVRLALRFWVWFPNNRRADLSNLIKCSEDAIAAALGFDDQWIDYISVERMGIDRKNPRCEVTLEALT